MRNIVFTLMLFVLTIGNAQAQEKPEAFKTIENLLNYLSDVDHERMRDTVTESFLLLEHGEVWTIEDLIKVAKPSDTVRTNYFSIIDFDEKPDLVTINYWNKANFAKKNESQDVYWLESAILKKVKGRWLISQLHSTRLPSGKVPENVVFKP
ncbi:nuclear transport factor 2 family protein [Microbulbifer sp. TRSA005]|uniref:nuclear transport factor 2 family protein n=1 Tax=Microbulbifer sp. TRSA005 TaxID=3243383 RepID=UPI00403A6347